MNKYLNVNGLSARQNIIRKLKNIISDSNYLWMLLIALMALSSCHNKTSDERSDNLKKNAVAANDSVNKPRVSIKVNRRYDDKGNIIGFDSTYSSYYSNAKSDTTEMDSLMNSFDNYFEMNHASFFRNEFKPLFFDDSLRYPDFFHNDYFMRRYELNDRYMRDMMHRMDSIKNKFYYDKSVKNKKS